MLKREGSTLSKRLSIVNLRPAPVVLASPKAATESTVGSPKASDEHLVAEQIVEEAEEEDKEEPRAKPLASSTTTPRMQAMSSPLQSPTLSPSPLRMRTKLHRTSSSLSITRSAADRFRAKDLDLVARHDEESRNNTSLSQYTESTFKPSKTYRSLTDFNDQDDESPRCLGGVLGALNNEQPTRRVSNSTPSPDKENTTTVNASPPKSPSRTNTLMLSRSGSRSPAGKRYAGQSGGGVKTSSWLESALMKSTEKNGNVTRSPRAVTRRDE